MRRPLRRRRHLLALTVAELCLPAPALGQGEHALDGPSAHVADGSSGLSDYATSKAQDDAEVRADDAQQRASLRLALKPGILSITDKFGGGGSNHKPRSWLMEVPSYAGRPPAPAKLSANCDFHQGYSTPCPADR